MTRKIGIILVMFCGAFLMVGCQPKYPNCKKDENCHEGEFCVNNRCEQCRDSNDCPAGQQCSGGGCVPIPGYCATNSDCAAGQVCRDNSCGPCVQNEDCGSDQLCVEGACTTPECMRDEQCPAGTTCVNYACKVTDEPHTEMGEAECTISPIYFDFDSSELGDDMKSTLENNFVCLQQRGGRVTLEGHCDAAGTTEYNMALGERRAKTIEKHLSRMGIDAKDMRTVSKGEEEASGKNVREDRRVEFK